MTAIQRLIGSSVVQETVLYPVLPTVLSFFVKLLQILLPQLEVLNADITVLSADTDAEKRKQEASSREVADLKDKLQQVRSGLCFSIFRLNPK